MQTLYISKSTLKVLKLINRCDDLLVYKSFYNIQNAILDWREPFNLQKGWLLWAGIGLAGALASIALTGAVMSLVRGENPQREVDYNFYWILPFRCMHLHTCSENLSWYSEK